MPDVYQHLRAGMGYPCCPATGSREKVDGSEGLRHLVVSEARERKRRPPPTERQRAAMKLPYATTARRAPSTPSSPWDATAAVLSGPNNALHRSGRDNRHQQVRPA